MEEKGHLHCRCHMYSHTSDGDSHHWKVYLGKSLPILYPRRQMFADKLVNLSALKLVNLLALKLVNLLALKLLAST